MSDHYFSIIRSEILSLLPENCSRVLEVGCGKGNTLEWLRHTQSCEWCGGVELFEGAAEIARPKLDALWHGNVEIMDLPIEPGTLDLVLCLDVLEHLVDPWATVRKLTGYLKGGGSMIVSLPNIRNTQVLMPLLLQGKWTYKDEGILDRTHLRFFVERTAQELLEQAGMTVDMVVEKGLGRSKKSQIVNAMLPRGFRSLFVRQYLLRGRKT